MILAKLWNGKSLTGEWLFTIKIDGVRAIKKLNDDLTDGWESRSGKPLYNLPVDTSDSIDFEVFVGSFKATMERIKSHEDLPIAHDCLYSLDPLDTRLIIGVVNNPAADYIRKCMEAARTHGHEGLILRQGNVWLKVKPEETHDVKIIGFVEGTGRNKGRLGALITERGKVGVGFSDEDRKYIWENQKDLQDTTVEVSCMQLTEAGKFRHARFIRLRPDK